MIELIYGGSGSGKSEYAENRVLKLATGAKYYLATMQVYGEEGRKRVERHRQLRKGKGFETLERCVNLQEFAKEIQEKFKGQHATVLLECVSNLVANEMFSTDLERNTQELVRDIVDGITSLSQQCEHLVIVTNNIFDDGMEYETETMRYIKVLGEVNQKLAVLSDSVCEIVAGIKISIS